MDDVQRHVLLAQGAQEGCNERRPPEERYPPVSVLVPCYCEEALIGETLRSCLALDYPDFEVVVVDDGSMDGSLEKILPFVQRGEVRLVAKARNEGKAMAINDAIPCLRGEIVFILDADSSPEPLALRHVVPPGRGRHREPAGPREGHVPAKAASHRVHVHRQHPEEGPEGVGQGPHGLGRGLKSALLDVGLFSPDMATEDIDITWKLQKRYYDVRYEPEAIVWMRVPRDLGALWKQRKRWTLGLAQVLRRHGRDVLTWKRRRMWPVFFESSLSILWAYVFLLLTAFWAFSYSVGHPQVGASPVPNWWGMLIAILCLTQLATGVLLDRRYDRSILRYLPVAVYYPLVYWLLMAVVTSVSTPRGLFSTSNVGSPTRWNTRRR